MRTTTFISLKSALIICLATLPGQAFSQRLWQPVDGITAPSKGTRAIIPQHYRLVQLDEPGLLVFLKTAGNDPDNALVIDLPDPSGKDRSFKIWRNSLLAPGLQKRYPQIQTFTAEATDNPYITAKIDYTPAGFHAMVFDPGTVWLIDPYSNQNDGYAIVYYQSDAPKIEDRETTCLINNDNRDELNVSGVPTEINDHKTAQKASGNIKRLYRLALSCTGEYAQAVGGSTPTKASVLAAMSTTMNRVNGIYEREVDVTMQLIDQEDSLIYLDPATDPFTANNNGSTLLGQNQNNTVQVIGDAAFDIGHIFSTGGGGIASLGSVCYQNYKARGVTGLANPVGDAFAVDYVAHEMGHQFGADHAFNDCNGNEYWRTAYEPGSGSTIMCYAGICGSQNNIQEHSDDYFHAISLTEIGDYLSGFGGTCAINSTLQVDTPTFAGIQQTYIIPAATPFEITVPPATTANPQDSLSYCWEQWDLGNLQQPEIDGATFVTGPTFRSTYPKTGNPTRIFPDIEDLLANQDQTPGERLPEVSRDMHFKLTVRNIKNGWGRFRISDDSLTVRFVNTNMPFEVTYPSDPGITLHADSTVTVTWNVAGTQSAPVSCSSVDVFLSKDGGYTYPYTIGSNLPNIGQAIVSLPNINTATARIKVKGHDNIFFDLSNNNFTIDGPTGIGDVALQERIMIFPNPATNKIHIQNNGHQQAGVQVMNSLGQIIWQGTVHRSLTLNTGNFARGLYMVKLSNKTSGATFTTKIILK
ncbi:MAG TPA: zinc-dependent metalloprotease family protein [Edaphocola sp.]|nr:zinc-dependent metalloprotease family protein [Edaphocola sp.]